MTNRHLMETQNLVISFDYSWFLAKNLAYTECRIMKFHYRNSSISHLLELSKGRQLLSGIKVEFDQFGITANNNNKMLWDFSLSCPQRGTQKSAFGFFNLTHFWQCTISIMSCGLRCWFHIGESNPGCTNVKCQMLHSHRKSVTLWMNLTKIRPNLYFI